VSPEESAPSESIATARAAAGDAAPSDAPPLPRALFSTNPIEWLRVFGPGAVIASLTIGSGELVFSTRAGSLFGERVLWVFLWTCVFKWALMYSAARHLVLSGRHPLERWADLPGPRGWLPILFILIAIPAFPIWIGFLSGVTATLLAASEIGLDRTTASLVVLAIAFPLAFAGGYRTLERVQLVIIVSLLAGIVVSLALLSPDLLAAAQGLLVPGTLEYPSWVAEKYPTIADRPIWVECGTYVAVIGGSGFDYLAYTSYLRDKGWGLARAAHVEPARPSRDSMSEKETATLRAWTRAPLIDGTVSFIIVIAFSAVFVLSARLVLAPRHEVPDEDQLLGLQAQFLTEWSPLLRWLWIAGAFAAMFGTVYGTIEVAPALGREIALALGKRLDLRGAARQRRWILTACAVGSLIVVAWTHSVGKLEEGKRPTTLVEIITPASIFTGVLACGVICLLLPGTDRRHLPKSLRMPPALAALNLIAGVVFLGIGAQTWVNHVADRASNLGKAAALALLLIPVAVSAGLAFAIGRWRGRVVARMERSTGESPP
jgi:hypothetical protein